LEDNSGDGLRPPSGGRGRELAAADLGFEGFPGEGWGRCTGLRGEGKAGQAREAGRCTGARTGGVTTEGGNADVRGGGGGRTGDRQNDVVPSFSPSSINFFILRPSLRHKVMCQMSKSQWQSHIMDNDTNIFIFNYILLNVFSDKKHDTEEKEEFGWTQQRNRKKSS
jgi:hypothetical protein